MRLASGCLCAAMVLASSSAWASPDLVLNDATQMMSGTHRYRQVRLTNTKITVTPSDGNDNTGYLQIVAHSILIDAQSSIVATASGTKGVQNGSGQGNGAGVGASTSAGPGGGGGHGGKAGPGVALAGCVVDPFALGGAAYGSSGDQLTQGSSGSAAATGLLDAGAASRGGNAGGLIDLQAGKIELLGGLIADGEDCEPATEPAGGGSGGGVRLAAVVFATWGDTAVVHANGGKGGVSLLHEGGSGGGGKIFLAMPQAPAIVNLGVEPGVSGCAQASGGKGIVQYFPALPCNDWDGDGMLSDQCTGPSGADCDDTDKSAYPGAEERCNGMDDDCDGVVDDGAGADCAGGACIGGVCTGAEAGADAEPPDSGIDASAEGGGADDGGDGGTADGAAEAGGSLAEFELRGGCSVPRSRGIHLPWGLLVFGIGLVQRWAWRRRTNLAGQRRRL